MATRFKCVKGMRDFHPEEMAVRNWIVDAWKRVSLRNGFVEYDGPMLEYLDLFRVKSGEGIVSELFSLTDRGGRKLALRPEMTPTLARMVGERAQSLARPLRWFSVPRLCRAEKPQRGRLREFFQWNIDIIGEEDAAADADGIFVAVDFFREMGLSPAQVEVRINSRALIGSILRVAGVSEARHAEVFAVLDKRDKLSEAAYHDAVAALGLSATQQKALTRWGSGVGATALATVQELVGDDEIGLRELERVHRLFKLLGHLGIGDYCRFDLSVVRGLAYYTGIVFEAYGRGGLRRAICGGGRYDRLLEDLGGPPMSGVGFASSDVVIQDLLEEFGLLAPPTAALDYFIAETDPELFPSVLALAAELRAANHATAFAYRRLALGKQLKQAASRNARQVIIVDQDTRQRHRVQVRNMATGEQKQVDIQALIGQAPGEHGTGH